MNHLLLTNEPLDVGAINDMVAHESCGAISLFIGTTRDNFDNKKVLCLEYEAYEPMAVKEMQAICKEIRGRWTDVVNMAIYHRLGLVPVREASVVIAISSPHRQTALDAVGFAIEELKRRVPIWKKEKYEDDESTWKENKESSSAGKRLKRPKLNFGACGVQDLSSVPHSLVQIAAKEHEIYRRIQCFVEKKREEIDINNIMDFTANKQVPSSLPESDSDNTSTCARINSGIVKQEHSKCHLKVRRVENRNGPQTKPNYLRALDKLMSKGSSAAGIKQEQPDIKPTIIESPSKELPGPLQERITNIETHLRLPLVNPKHVYERLKTIENRILHLESISPEYNHFLTEKSNHHAHVDQQHHANNTYEPRKTYSVDELNTIIANMDNECDKDLKQEDVRSQFKIENHES